MVKKFLAWRIARVRGPGVHSDRTGWHVSLTPHFGIGTPWFKGQLLRCYRLHGLQIIKWITDGRYGRWCVKKQVLGRSRVVGEIYVQQTGEK